MGLNQLAQDIYANTKNKGFYDDPQPVSGRLMLVVSELAEALEADRREHYANLREYEEQIGIPPVLGVAPFSEVFEHTIKDTFEDEVADAIIRLLDLCAHHGIDIERHIALKMRYNALRPHKHGKKY